jgi:hypothetical protein
MYYIGIYTITCLINNKIYVGHTENSGNRAAKHLNSLRINKHTVEELQKDYNKYGENSFLLEMLVECPKELLYSEEHYWCNLLNVHDPNKGYNVQPTNPYGIGKHSEKTRIKRSKSLSKPIILLSNKGEFIREYDSIKNAAKDLNIKDSNITCVLKNRYKLCKNYKFVYKKDYNSNIDYGVKENE